MVAVAKKDIVLKVEKLKKAYGPVTIVEGFDLKVAAGEEAVGAWGAVRSGRAGQAESVESAELETGVRWVCMAGGPLGCPGGGDARAQGAAAASGSGVAGARAGRGGG